VASAIDDILLLVLVDNDDDDDDDDDDCYVRLPGGVADADRCYGSVVFVTR